MGNKKSNPQTTNNQLTRSVHLVSLGDSRVGKSSILNRFRGREFNHCVEPTIGATFLSHSIEVNGYLVKFAVWDTAGRERYRPLAAMHYRGASAALVVYDITKRKSFESAKKWVEEVRAQEGKQFVIGLAGNKVDEAVNHREVSREEAHAYAGENELVFFETSAKDNINVKEMFHAIAERIMNEEKGQKSEKSNANEQKMQMDNNNNNNSNSNSNQNLLKKRDARRLLYLQKGDPVDINPIHQHRGWKRGTIYWMDQDPWKPLSSGRVRVAYEYDGERFCYWTHLDNDKEIAECGSRTGDYKKQQQQQPCQPQPQREQQQHHSHHQHQHQHQQQPWYWRCPMCAFPNQTKSKSSSCVKCNFGNAAVLLRCKTILHSCVMEKKR